MSEQYKMTTEQTMQQILQAEQDAKQAIAGCEQTALRLLDQARQKAVTIVERSNSRIAHVKRYCSRVVANEIASIRREEGAGLGEKNGLAFEAFDKDQIVRELAESMTTGENSG